MSLLTRLSACALALAATLPASAAWLEVHDPVMTNEGSKYCLDMARGGGSLVIQGDRDWKGLGHNSAYTFDSKDVMVLHAHESADGRPLVDQSELKRYQSVRLP